MSKEVPFYDVIIVGAGLSGIGAAYHIQHKCPSNTYKVLEGRAAIGGTWDLFKYPGIRSDSDMYTLGFSFNPWKDPKAIADGPAILRYINETADKFGITQHIQFNHKVAEAGWSEEHQEWTLKIASHSAIESETIRCKFLFMCSGYYDYEHGHEPTFPKSEAFRGTIIHPQKWDTSLEYENKNVVIIGSGATAVTLVPEMAKKAANVTMLQRSPTYIMTLPSEDVIANTLKKILPAKVAHSLARWKNILASLSFYKIARKWPKAIKKFILKGVKTELNGSYDLKHFTPTYDPWDQRLCLVPDSDLFNSIKEGKVAVETDTIQEFTSKGILLDSGKELNADIIVTATGLKIQLMGGMKLKVNGEEQRFSDLHTYKGVMFSGVPNFALAVGYTNASWTLKCDLNCHFVTRVLNHMKEGGFTTCTPNFNAEKFDTEPLLDFDAGYIKRALDILPKQGSEAPWKIHQNYLRDTLELKFKPVNDAYLIYK